MKKAEISDAFDRLGAKGECPICGINDWYGTGAEGEAAPRIPVMKTDGNPGWLPTLVLICANCAFIRQHAINFLQRQAAEHGDEKDE